jgi:prespore-specific regulator
MYGGMQMGSTRQDAWNHDEDLLLAEVVLRHIREGGTQLAAFEEVGKNLSRTPAACGFRWNSLIRKKYEAAIAMAKKQRKQTNQQPAKAKKVAKVEENDQVKVMNTGAQSMCMEDVINYLQNLQETEDNAHSILEEYHQLKEDYSTLMEQNNELECQVNKLQEEYEKVHEDYKVLLNFMDQARKMALTEDGDESSQVKFQMDYNGNLQKVEK